MIPRDGMIRKRKGTKTTLATRETLNEVSLALNQGAVASEASLASDPAAGASAPLS